MCALSSGNSEIITKPSKTQNRNKNVNNKCQTQASLLIILDQTQMGSGNKILSLKQFMIRQEVLKLYRTFFRTIYKLPDKRQQEEMAAWVRSDFKANANIDPANEDQIKALLYQGQKMHNELKNNVDFSQA